MKCHTHYSPILHNHTQRFQFNCPQCKRNLQTNCQMLFKPICPLAFIHKMILCRPCQMMYLPPSRFHLKFSQAHAESSEFYGFRKLCMHTRCQQRQHTSAFIRFFCCCLFSIFFSFHAKAEILNRLIHICSISYTMPITIIAFMRCVVTVLLFTICCLQMSI